MDGVMHFTIQIEGRHRPLTPWLPGSVRPAHPGVYQRNYPGGLYSYWDGRAWCVDAATPEGAAEQDEASAHQDAPWRGLADGEAPP
jgi:hypothetical protein